MLKDLDRFGLGKRLYSIIIGDLVKVESEIMPFYLITESKFYNIL